ncbi:undecaprenyl-phosphate glucose phosphotransferase, partial [Flavobacterium sp. WLB]
MTVVQTGRYSKYIRPISILIDLIVIAILSFFVFKELVANTLLFVFYQYLGWSLIAFSIKFYDVYRFTPPVVIASKIFQQTILFLLIVIAFFPFSKHAIFEQRAIAIFAFSITVLISIFKFLLFFYLKKYRIITGSNYRNAIIIGFTPEAIRLKDLFETRKDYGY